MSQRPLEVLAIINRADGLEVTVIVGYDDTSPPEKRFAATMPSADLTVDAVQAKLLAFQAVADNVDSVAAMFEKKIVAATGKLQLVN